MVSVGLVQISCRWVTKNVMLKVAKIPKYSQKKSEKASKLSKTQGLVAPSPTLSPVHIGIKIYPWIKESLFTNTARMRRQFY